MTFPLVCDDSHMDHRDFAEVWSWILRKRMERTNTVDTDRCQQRSIVGNERDGECQDEREVSCEETGQ